MVQKILAWAQRNERHLGAVVFVCGFVTDVFTFVFLDVSLVNMVFAVYLAVAALAIFIGHVLRGNPPEKDSVRYRSALVILPLLAQYLIGNLLSGFLIFYTKSAVLGASWPFLILLALIFIGNEWFRKHKDRIAFMATLLFFTTYAYAIFALPLFLGFLGPLVFLGSTAIAVAVFGLYLMLLWRVAPSALVESLAPIVAATIAIVIVMVVSYFAELVPPIPLTLKESGIYHAVSHQGGDYMLLAEKARPWYDLAPQPVHTVSGETLYAFTSVFAPVRFGAGVVHRWQRYDSEKGVWVTRSRIVFPISGGRSEGYRGYSEVTNVYSGEWRLRVETETGQVIGQHRFTVERGAQLPAMHIETH